MENKNNEPSENNKEDKEKKGTFIEHLGLDNKKPVAKDLVELKHVDVKKQVASPETMDLARSLKQQILEHDKFEKLSNDELTILESFAGKRLFLTRIAIIVNQSRVPLGIEPFKKAELEKILDDLTTKGYVTSEMVGEKRVYYLTERGKYRVQ